ncbi:hypothetical protein SVIOM74S_02735 [Streptomyces violarus]
MPEYTSEETAVRHAQEEPDARVTDTRRSVRSAPGRLRDPRAVRAGANARQADVQDGYRRNRRTTVDQSRDERR